VVSTGLILPEKCGAVQTKNDGDIFERCCVQQTDSSVKKMHSLLGNLTVKQIYRQGITRLSARFCGTAEVLAKTNLAAL